MIRVATLNVNGIRSASSKGLHKWLENSGVDILCLQEVRMSSSDRKAEQLPPSGWFEVQVDAEKKGYAGVAIWSKIEPQNVITSIGLEWADKEGRVVAMVFDKLVVWSIYFPSGTGGKARQILKNEFNAHILSLSQSWVNEDRAHMICADVNVAHNEIDIHNPKTKSSGFLPHERQWFGQFLDSGWKDLFREKHPLKQEYTWWSYRAPTARPGNKGWRIDYILTTPKLLEVCKAVEIVGREPKLSDHCGVWCDLSI